MEITKGVSFEFKGGKAVLTADVGSLVIPAIDSFKAKVEAGEIDIVKGTDLDNVVVLKVVELIKTELAK